MFAKIKKSLTKTREGVFSKINRLVTAKRIIDDELLDELEELLDEPLAVMVMFPLSGIAFNTTY